MTVQDFAQILRTRWKFICGTVVVAVLAALAYALLTTPQYQASTRLFVSTTSDGTNSQTYDGGLFAERRVLSYNELLMGEILAQRTIDKLGLDMSAADLQEAVEASVPAGTVLIDVAVVDPSPVRARDIANTLADEFVVMAAGLETPVLGAQPNARVVIQQRAEIPDKPMNQGRLRILGIAAVMGVLLGAFIAVVRGRMDDSVRTAEDLERATGVGLLADVPYDEQRREIPLISFDSDRSAVAGAFRELRINLRFLEAVDGPRVLLVASCLPDEGRTMTVINLALALANAGHSVVVVDADLRRPRVGTCFGLAAQPGLSTVLTGDATVDEALQETRFPHLSALTAGAIPPDPIELLESQATKDVLGELGRRFDYVIVDSPSLLVTDAALLADSSQGVLMVARFGSTRAHQLADGVHSLRRAGAPLLGAVLTMAPAKKRPKADGHYDTTSGVHRDSPRRGGRQRRGAQNK
ncbi:MAG: polysaccharide biosynthesis tyrosine autokinase [Mycobacterium sp.]